MLRRVWRWRIYLIQLVLAVSSAVAGGSLYQLKAPATYIAFSGKLEIQYSIPANISLSNAFVRLVCMRDGQKPMEITTMGVLSQKTGKLSVECGIIEFAGRYSFKMYMHMGGPLLTETYMDVLWPEVHLSLPINRYVLTRSVSLQITSTARCGSKLHRQSLFIDLYFQRNPITQGYISLSDAKLIKTVNHTKISEAHTQHVFACLLFDLDGVYQAVLKSSYNSGSIIARSNVLTLTWSKSYNLNIRLDSIFPCKNTVRVVYTQPSCAKTEKTLMDRIRIYELKRIANGSLAAPLKRIYITERHAEPDLTSVLLSCKLFNTTASGFCFAYVSISRNGAVKTQKTVCLAAHPDSVLPVDGGWSQWSGWNECTAKCGAGKQNRFRMCNNPFTDHGGRFCEGVPIEWKSCFSNCSDSIPDGPLRSPKINPACACGCSLTSQSGEIIASGRCTGRAVWIIQVKKQHRVILTFKFFNLFETEQSVKIRDGDTPEADLLFSSSGQSPPSEIISSSNKMLIELITTSVTSSPSPLAIFPINASLPIHVHGFIASYTVRASDGSGRASTIVRRHKSSILESKVAVAGIALCVVIVIVAVAFVMFHRFYHKRYKYAMASTESPVHVARSASAYSSRASSPPPGITNVDIEAPLTGDPKRKDTLVSRGSSISSTCSAGLKKLRSKAESVSGSPKPSTKDYTPLPSPYAANASPEEFLHDANFFKASPVLKNCRPRSPKVHPSPKFRHSPVAASPLSPSKTKHELLTKKRQDKKSQEPERVVTGSSGSSSQNKASSTKTDKPPETPTPTSASFLKPIEKDVTSLGHSPGDRTPQNEVILLESLREEPSGCKESDVISPDPDQETTSFIQPAVKARRPVSLTESYSSDSLGAKPKIRTEKQTKKTKGATKTSAMEERQKLLPKPDGQSPKSPREENSGKSSTPKSGRSVKSSKSGKTLSPTRSINTPSDVVSVDLELEYDDFIEDDPLSYFELGELQKLRWQGGEKIGRKVREEDD